MDRNVELSKTLTPAGKIYGCIEAGGTKFVCAFGSAPEDLSQPVIIPTTTPSETLRRVHEYFQSVIQHVHLAGLGVGAFGPVDLDPDSTTYGYITSTPKDGWVQTNLKGYLEASLDLHVAFDTDVNAAALGEAAWGAGRGLRNLVYITVGTGIGMGGLAGGALLHGMQHPETGHLFVPHDRQMDPFPGICPYHQDCLEGLASGPALARRWGAPAENLPPDHPAWEIESGYLAYLAANVILTLSPQRLIMGGGVMQQPQLLPEVRRKTSALLNGYIQLPQVASGLDKYITAPGLGTKSGILGALALARQA